MEDQSPTHAFSNLHHLHHHHHHHHRHRPSFNGILPSLQSPDLDYPSSQHGLESQEQYGGRGEEPMTLFPTSNSSSVARRGNSRVDQGFLNTTRGCLDGDNGMASPFDFADAWYDSGKKEKAWDDGESCESAAGDFYGKVDSYGNVNDVYYSRDCGTEAGVSGRVKSNYSSFPRVCGDIKTETGYIREAGHHAQETASYGRGSATSFSDSSVDYSRTDSRVGDNYLGREEDYGSSSGSGEDQIQVAEVEQGPWLSFSTLTQTGEGRWRRGSDFHTLTSGSLPQRSPITIRSGTQKLDSFSEAFLSQRKRIHPVVPSGDPSGQIWEFGAGKSENPGLVKSRHSCTYDSEAYPPPSSASPSLPSFPSPPTSSHLMSSVLSPPPTPLPPPSHSPSKMDSPSTFVGSAYSPSQGGETISALQFFASRLQPLPPVHSPGMLWKFPLLSHCFPQSADDPGGIEGSRRPSSVGDYHNTTASHDILQPTESLFFTSSSHQSSLKPSRPFYPSCHLLSRPSHLSGQRSEAVENAAPHMMTQKVWNGPSDLSQPQPQKQSSLIYTGTPFPSMLLLSHGRKRGRYTPRPLLNPVRGGAGLYCSLSSLHPTQGEVAWGKEEEECGLLPWVNVGPDFQAELPPCRVGRNGPEVWPPKEESPREQLLWTPWDRPEEGSNLQDQVEKLLLMCSSSCLPGGGSNIELALHCLHCCQGNIMATLEMLLLTQPSPTRDYHYSGSDFWADSERSLFAAALGSYGKDFSLIQKMVKTKTVRQCVEFYYLSKKLLDKQNKQREEESRNAEMEQQKSATPTCQPVDRQFGLAEAVPAPPLASFFPCKLCGKMFFKIKSRNAHMKIHRQPQEDWTERRLQHQLLTQRLAHSHPANLAPASGSNLLQPQAPVATFPLSGLPGASNKTADGVFSPAGDPGVLDPGTPQAYGSVGAPNSHVNIGIGAGDPKQREAAAAAAAAVVAPFHQSWGSFGHSPDGDAFYCDPEGKEAVEMRGMKEPLGWQ